MPIETWATAKEKIAKIYAFVHRNLMVYTENKVKFDCKFCRICHLGRLSAIIIDVILIVFKSIQFIQYMHAHVRQYGTSYSIFSVMSFISSVNHNFIFQKMPHYKLIAYSQILTAISHYAPNFEDVDGVY